MAAQGGDRSRSAYGWDVCESSLSVDISKEGLANRMTSSGFRSFGTNILLPLPQPIKQLKRKSSAPASNAASSRLREAGSARSKMQSSQLRMICSFA